MKIVHLRQLLEYGVEIQSITITNVHLPADISETMEKETTYESLSLKAQRQQQYELLVSTSAFFEKCL